MVLLSSWKREAYASCSMISVLVIMFSICAQRHSPVLLVLVVVQSTAVLVACVLCEEVLLESSLWGQIFCGSPHWMQA